jgi:hypothetical protein
VRLRATKLLFVCGVLLGLAVPASAAAAPVNSGHAEGSFLYVQETAGGSIERLGGGAYRLRLTGVSPRVTSFTDRPRRRAGRQSLQTFVASWRANGFAADPPNAALVLDHAPASHDVALLTLSHPHYDRARHTLTYRATPLRGRDPALASFARRADPVGAEHLGAASLFVDDGGGGLSNVTFNISGAATASSVQLLLLDGAAWRLDPTRALSFSGTFPITYLNATETALNFGLDPGSPLNFTVSLPIEVQPGGTPVVEVTNVTGNIIVEWPSDVGPQVEVLESGEPVNLGGLAS